MAVGKKTGGRKKGVRNRAGVAKAEAVAASGLTPLDYLLFVMRDPQAEAQARQDAAKAAAPYVHPRLSAIEHTGRDGGPIQTEDVNIARDHLSSRIASVSTRVGEDIGPTKPH